MTTNLKTPTVHLNGTSVHELESQLENAVHALNGALEALVQATPNPRDYYPQGAGAFQQAIKEHESRLERLRTVDAELMEIYIAVVG